MRKPVILTVDDDPDVLRAIERDLKKHYEDRYRILRADSGRAALDLLRRVQLRNDPVALLLVDHRMPEMNGVETLQEAIKLYPNAKRTLLTAYADTDAAIKAINDVQLNYYLLKPWDPPEQQLFPVLDDLLNDWYADFHPPFEGLRVLGTRWSSKSYDIGEFLARNQVPYQWLDADAADRDVEVGRLLKRLSREDLKLPLVLFPDGSCVSEPQTLELAERLGLRTRAGLEFYDLAIVGGGPAGLAAAVYGASEGLKTIMVEREGPGGQAGQSSRIENYLGFPAGLSGSDLTQRATTQARRLGADPPTLQDTAGLRIEGAGRIVELSGGENLSASTVLIASGVSYRQLDAPGFPELTGQGIYYGAALTDARECTNQHVVVIGGANSAGQAAVYLSSYAGRVTMLVRGDSLEKSMSHYLIEQIEALDNIE